jgi:trans-aconitate methyltransferase
MANDNDNDNAGWNPALYQTRAAFVPALGAELIDLLAPAPGEEVLDLGCGTGELTAALAARGARVVGVDASEAMIARARERLPDLDLRVGDGQALAFEAAFDGVFSNAALHWMLRADDAAAGIARALRPGGRLVAEFGGAGCVAAVRAAAAAALQALGEDGATWLRWYFPTVAAYAAVLERAGLEPRLVHLFDRPTRFEGADGLGAWLRLFVQPLHAHLGARWPAFVRDVEARCPRLRDGDGWTLDYVRLRVIARKPRSA